MTSVLLDFGVASHFFPIAGITAVGILVCTATVIGGQFCRSCAHDENCWLRFVSSRLARFTKLCPNVVAQAHLPTSPQALQEHQVPPYLF